LRRAPEHIQSKGYTLPDMSDHRVSQSLYLLDPDNTEIELFVDDRCLG